MFLSLSHPLSCFCVRLPPRTHAGLLRLSAQSFNSWPPWWQKPAPILRRSPKPITVTASSSSFSSSLGFWQNGPFQQRKEEEHLLIKGNPPPNLLPFSCHANFQPEACQAALKIRLTEPSTDASKGLLMILWFTCIWKKRAENNSKNQTLKVWKPGSNSTPLLPGGNAS